MSAERDLYKILQVDPEADLDIIQTVYRRLAQKYHPDRNGGSDAAAARMIELNGAWEVLRDPARREAYDRERAHQEGVARSIGRRPGASSPPDSRATGAGATAARPAGYGTGQSPRAASRSASWRSAAGASAGRSTDGGSDWSAGRSSYGGGYDPTMRAPDGPGAAGPPPGNPEGSVLSFGRYVGWSLGEIARVDLEFLEWLERSPAGRQYREELDALLRRHGRRKAPGDDAERRGLYRR